MFMGVVVVGLGVLLLWGVGVLLLGWGVAVGLVGSLLVVGVVLGIGLWLLLLLPTCVSFTLLVSVHAENTYLRLVLVLVPIVMLAGMMMAVVRLLPWRPWLRWWIEIPLVLWLWRTSWRRLLLCLALAVVGVVWRWWAMVALRVRRKVLRSGVVVVCCHVGECVIVVVVVVISEKKCKAAKI